MKKTLLLGFILAMGMNAAVIDFESLTDLTPVTNQFPGLTFTSATVLSLGGSLPLEFPPYSGQNVIFDNGGIIVIDLAASITSFTGFFTYSTPLTVAALDASNNILQSVTSLFASNLAGSGDAGSSPNEFISLSYAPGFARIGIAGAASGSSFTADDLDFAGATSSVPEPGTVSLLLVGLAAVGARVRFRARK
jgi:hypothetical protein